jgi:hypothetical protein
VDLQTKKDNEIRFWRPKVETNESLQDQQPYLQKKDEEIREIASREEGHKDSF